jgi:integrative and conjugative element protein (TIGR02256 family)
VRILRAALADATAAASTSLPKETGGILLGWREPDAIVVARLIEVADPDAGHTTYTRSHAHAEAVLQRALADAPCGDVVGYVGEWHVHPALQGPSRQDRRELRAVARRSAHAVALIVLAPDGPTGSWSPSALTARSCRVRIAQISWAEAA